VSVVSRLRRAPGWLAGLRHWRLVQADDPIALVFRHDDGGPVLGELDEHGRLADASGHRLWMIAAWLPEGREDEAARLLAAHGVEVYRMWLPEGRE
jgi:hypothetical protein